MAQDVVPVSIEETVAFSWRETVLRGLWSYLCLTAIGVSLIIVMLAGMGAFFAIGGPAPAARLRAMPILLAQFFAFSWCFFSLVMFPLCFYWATRSRNRTIRASAGRLLVQVGRRKREIDLAECMWKVSSFPMDEHGAYFPGRSLVIVGNLKGWHTCGFTQKKRTQWVEFLAAAGVEHLPLVKWRQVALVVPMASIGGGLLGLAIGRIAAGFGAPAALIGMLGFLGFLDGLLGVLAYLSCIHWWRKHAGRGGFIALGGLMFAGIALNFLMFAGLVAALILVGGNGLAGAIVGWYAYELAGRRQQQEATKVSNVYPRATDPP